MSNNPVKVGLVGFGLFGQHHAKAIEAAAETDLAAIVAKSEASRGRAREMFPQTPVFASQSEMLAAVELELVDIVVPNVLHFEHAREALTAGKHVLLEKPMALTEPHCRELVKLARQQEKVLAVGHELRLSSLWGKARELIDEGVIGDVQHVMVELSRFPYRPGAEGWRYDLQRVGSWILEEPIHFFDLARWYLSDRGEPESIYACANSRHADHPELLDNFLAVLKFPQSGQAVIVQTLSAFGHHQTAKISGTRGTLWAYWSAADARSERSQYGLTYGLGDDVRTCELTAPAGELLELAEEIRAVARCVRTGNAPPCSGRDGWWSTRLCLAAQESIESGQIVTLAPLTDD